MNNYCSLYFFQNLKIPLCKINPVNNTKWRNFKVTYSRRQAGIRTQTVLSSSSLINNRIPHLHFFIPFLFHSCLVYSSCDYRSFRFHLFLLFLLLSQLFNYYFSLSNYITNIMPRTFLILNYKCFFFQYTYKRKGLTTTMALKC